MLGHLYDRALGGERCWIRHEDGEVRPLPAHRWLGDAMSRYAHPATPSTTSSTRPSRRCAPGRRSSLDAGRDGWSRGSIQRGIPALGIDRSATAIRLAGRGGAPALLGDVFEPLPGMGRWQTVLLVDGNVGLGGDPRRILARAAELLGRGGRCVAEFDTEAIGIRARWVRLESARDVGPWFRWASVGVDSAATLAAQVGLTLTGVRLIGGRVIASLPRP